MKHYIPKMTSTDYLSRRREEGKFPALETALMHQYNDLKNTQKSAEED